MAAARPQLVILSYDISILALSVKELFRNMPELTTNRTTRDVTCCMRWNRYPSSWNRRTWPARLKRKSIMLPTQTVSVKA